MKHLFVNLTKYLQEPCKENYNTVVKEIKELKKWRDGPCSSLGRLAIAKLWVLHSLICTANEMPARYFVNIDKLTLRFIWRSKRPRMADTMLNNTIRKLTLPTLESTVKLQQSRLGGSDKRINKPIKKTEEKIQKQTYISIINWSLMKEQGQ